MNVFILPFLLLEYLQAIPWQFWLSLGLTVIHTADEVLAKGGPIWEYLRHFIRSPKLALFVGYILFQLMVVCLAGLAYLGGNTKFTVALCVVRLVDVIFTHNVLRVILKPNPGYCTSWLLFLDILVAVYICYH